MRRRPRAIRVAISLGVTSNNSTIAISQPTTNSTIEPICPSAPINAPSKPGADRAGGGPIDQAHRDQRDYEEEEEAGDLLARQARRLFKLAQQQPQADQAAARSARRRSPGQRCRAEKQSTAGARRPAGWRAC